MRCPESQPAPSAIATRQLRSSSWRDVRAAPLETSRYQRPVLRPGRHFVDRQKFKERRPAVLAEWKNRHVWLDTDQAQMSRRETSLNQAGGTL
jgi:hypothetical protein